MGGQEDRKTKKSMVRILNIYLTQPLDVAKSKLLEKGNEKKNKKKKNSLEIIRPPMTSIT
jgi:hypothetical protein